MGEWHKLQTLLSTIYPPRCMSCGDAVDNDFGLCGACWRETEFIGSSVCDSCGTPLPGEAEPDEKLICDGCHSTPKPWTRGRAALMYRGTGRRLVLGLKHGDRQDIARPAGKWLKQAGQHLLDDETALIAPVPLHWSRLMSRRYNQAALLAHALAKETKMDWCPDLLQRPKRTPSLDGKSREERANTVDAAFSVTPKRRHRIIGRRVILVDDVMTSGATFAATAQACLDAGADHVHVLALARVANDP